MVDKPICKFKNVDRTFQDANFAMILTQKQKPTKPFIKLFLNQIIFEFTKTNSIFELDGQDISIENEGSNLTHPSYG